MEGMRWNGAGKVCWQERLGPGGCEWVLCRRGYSVREDRG